MQKVDLANITPEGPSNIASLKGPAILDDKISIQEEGHEAIVLGENV